MVAYHDTIFSITDGVISTCVCIQLNIICPSWASNAIFHENMQSPSIIMLWFLPLHISPIQMYILSLCLVFRQYSEILLSPREQTSLYISVTMNHKSLILRKFYIFSNTNTGTPTCEHDVDI